MRYESGRNIGHQMVVTLKSNTRKYGHEIFSVHMVEHSVEHETPMVAQSGHQENHSLRSHIALLRGHQKTFGVLCSTVLKTRFFNLYSQFSASKFNSMTTRKYGHEIFCVHMVEHSVEHETPMVAQSGHQENHSLRSHIALLRGHQKTFGVLCSTVLKTRFFNMYSQFSASKFNSMTN